MADLESEKQGSTGSGQGDPGPDSSRPDGSRPDSSNPGSSGKGSPAFLLAQVGAHAAQAFGRRIAGLSVTPAQAGILRMLKMHSPLSQRELASKLGMHASRLVAILDEMEAADLAFREVSASDRRIYQLRITEKGLETLREIGLLYQAHNAAITAALSDEERATLTSLLERIAAEQGLTPGVHPGYQSYSGKGPGR